MSGMAAIPMTLPGNHCEVHGYHWPPPLRTVRHHILPQEYDGPTVPSNLVLVCDNGHYNIHAYLDALLAGQPLPRATRRERALAKQGYDAITGSAAATASTTAHLK